MFREWLRNKLNERGWSPQKLAEVSGLERSHIYKLLSESYKQQPRRVTVMRIATALGVPVSEAMRAAGYASSANIIYDTNDLVAETLVLLRDVPENRYTEAMHFLRKQLDTAREIFLKEETSAAT